MSKKHRILIVDDEDKVLFVLREVLTRLGDQVEILTAHNGQEALAYMRANPVDLVITDLIMPGMNGIALTEVAYAIYPETKVIWITAYDQRGDDAQRLAVQRYLNKPINLFEFRKIVCEELGIDNRNGNGKALSAR